MIGWLIYKQEDAVRNEDFINWFIREAKKQNINLQLILREDLSISPISEDLFINGKKVTLPQFVIIRTMEPLLNKSLEIRGIHTFNNSFVSHIANHKGRTYQYAIEQKVKIPKTLFYPKGLIPQEIPLQYPLVLKYASSKGGTDVHFFEDDITLRNYLTSKPTTDDYLLQETNVHLGKDIRVFILNNEIVAAVLRENNKDFRANFTLGGSASLYSLSADEKSIINQILQGGQFDFVGIDFLIDLNGQLVFNEIEDAVGSRTLSHLTDINIVKDYLSHIKNVIKKEQSH